MEEKELTRLEANRRLIGKTITVMRDGGRTIGLVKGVKDEDTFFVSINNLDVEVDIFDIRY